MSSLQRLFCSFPLPKPPPRFARAVQRTMSLTYPGLYGRACCPCAWSSCLPCRIQPARPNRRVMCKIGVAEAMLCLRFRSAVLSLAPRSVSSLQHQLPIANVDPTVELSADFLEVGNFLESQLLMERNAACVGQSDAADRSVKAGAL